MRDGIIYDCPNANCRTPIYTGKCSKACIEKHNKELGIKPKTNADRFRAMSDEEQQKCVRKFWEIEDFADWLQQPAEGE